MRVADKRQRALLNVAEGFIGGSEGTDGADVMQIVIFENNRVGGLVDAHADHSS